MVRASAKEALQTTYTAMIAAGRNRWRDMLSFDSAVQPVAYFLCRRTHERYRISWEETLSPDSSGKYARIVNAFLADPQGVFGDLSTPDVADAQNAMYSLLIAKIRNCRTTVRDHNKAQGSDWIATFHSKYDESHADHYLHGDPEILSEATSTGPLPQPMKAEPIKTESMKTEPTKTEPTKTEPIKTKSTMAALLDSESTFTTGKQRGLTHSAVGCASPNLSVKPELPPPRSIDMPFYRVSDDRLEAVGTLEITEYSLRGLNEAAHGAFLLLEDEQIGVSHFAAHWDLNGDRVLFLASDAKIMALLTAVPRRHGAVGAALVIGSRRDAPRAQALVTAFTQAQQVTLPPRHWDSLPHRLSASVTSSRAPSLAAEPVHYRAPPAQGDRPGLRSSVASENREPDHSSPDHSLDQDKKVSAEDDPSVEQDENVSADDDLRHQDMVVVFAAASSTVSRPAASPPIDVSSASGTVPAMAVSDGDLNIADLSKAPTPEVLAMSPPSMPPLQPTVTTTSHQPEPASLAPQPLLSEMSSTVQPASMSPALHQSQSVCEATTGGTLPPSTLPPGLPHSVDQPPASQHQQLSSHDESLQSSTADHTSPDRSALHRSALHQSALHQSDADREPTHGGTSQLGTPQPGAPPQPGTPSQSGTPPSPPQSSMPAESPPSTIVASPAGGHSDGPPGPQKRRKRKIIHDEDDDDDDEYQPDAEQKEPEGEEATIRLPPVLQALLDSRMELDMPSAVTPTPPIDLTLLPDEEEEDYIGLLLAEFAGLLQQDRITEVLITKLFAFLGTGPERRRTMKPHSFVKMPGVLGAGPYLHQLYTMFAIELIHFQNRKTHRKDDRKWDQVLGAILAHEMGISKTMYFIIRFVLNMICCWMRRDCAKNPSRHTFDKNCRQFGLGCWCDPQGLLRAFFDATEGVYIHLTLPSLLSQCFTEWKTFVDVDWLEENLGHPVTLVVGHQDSQSTSYARDVSALAPTAAEFRAHRSPSTTWSDVLALNPLGEDLHEYLRRANASELQVPAARKPASPPEMCFIVSTLWSLDKQVVPHLQRVAMPAVAAIQSTDMWQQLGRYPLACLHSDRCTGWPSLCKGPKAHAFPATHLGARSEASVQIATISVDEFHLVAWHSARAHLKAMEIDQQRTFGRGPPIVLMSGTPTYSSPFDPLGLWSCHECPEWDNKDSPLGDCRYAVATQLKADWGLLVSFVTTGTGGDKLWASLTDDKRPNPLTAKRLIEMFWKVRKPALDALFQIAAIRHDYDTMMLGQPLQIRPPIEYFLVHCHNPPEAIPLLAEEVDRVRRSRPATAAAEHSDGPHAGPESGQPPRKRPRTSWAHEPGKATKTKSAKAAETRDSQKKLSEGIRLFNMEKDIPHLCTLRQEDPSIWLSTTCSQRGYYKAKLREHPAFGDVAAVFATSGKLQKLVELIGAYWGSNWRDRVVPEGDGSEFVDPHDPRERLPPILIPIHETALGPFLVATLEHKFPRIRVDGLWPDVVGQDRGEKIDHFNARLDVTGKKRRRPTDVLILPAKTSGEGLNLSICNFMIHFDVVKTQGKAGQVNSRAARPPKTHSTRVLQLVLDEDFHLDQYYLAVRTQRADMIPPLGATPQAGEGEGKATEGTSRGEGASTKLGPDPSTVAVSKPANVGMEVDWQDDGLR